MPSLSMYLLGPDVELLVGHLDSDEEIAWLVSDGPGRWAAQPERPPLEFPRYGLWHVPSGPLPLAEGGREAEDNLIEDPWSGWQEKLAGYAFPAALSTMTAGAKRASNPD